MSFNSRIRTVKRAGYNSYTFSIVENWRDESKGMKTNHRDVAYLGTYKEHFLYSPIVQGKLWMKIDLAINKLLKSGVIDTVDVQKITNRFGAFVPRVKVSAITPFSSKNPLRKPIVK
jgi:hypothetical protein